MKTECRTFFLTKSGKKFCEQDFHQENPCLNPKKFKKNKNFKIKMAPPNYVERANRGFNEVGRSVIPYAPKSGVYFNKEYNPITPNYRNNQKSDYNSTLENKCYNC